MKLTGKTKQRVINNLLIKKEFIKKNGHYQKQKTIVKLVKEGRDIIEIILSAKNDLIKELKELGFKIEKSKTLIKWGHFILKIKY